MTIQTIITTMNLVDASTLLEKINIQTDFIIGNQTSYTKDERIFFNGHEGVTLSRCEKGVGRNRNLLLSKASADVCVIADDDMVFYDNYETTVNELFRKHIDADVLIFNIDSGGVLRRKNNKIKRVGRFNYMNYGAARIAFRRKSTSYYNISFNTNFGGGTLHSAGEDSLFIRECLRNRLRVLAVPISIAKIDDERESTWFRGYDDKYRFDKGVFLALAHPILSNFFALYLMIRHPEFRGTKPLLKALVDVNNGINYVRKRKYI